MRQYLIVPYAAAPIVPHAAVPDRPGRTGAALAPSCAGMGVFSPHAVSQLGIADTGDPRVTGK